MDGIYIMDGITNLIEKGCGEKTLRENKNASLGRGQQWHVLAPFID